MFFLIFVQSSSQYRRIYISDDLVLTDHRVHRVSAKSIVVQLQESRSRDSRTAQYAGGYMLHDDRVRVSNLPSHDSRGHLEVHVWSANEVWLRQWWLLTCRRVTSKVK